MSLIAEIRRQRVAPGHVTLWWLGQAGFVIKSPAGKLIVLDPYLSNSCAALGAALGFNMERLVPPPMLGKDLAGVDLYVLTHSHQDHLDPETLAGYRQAGGRGPYLAPAETVEKLQALGVSRDAIHLTLPNHEYVVGDLTVRATLAIPFAGDDLTHVGYLVGVAAGPKIYFTGDTGYHEVLGISVAEHKPDVMVTVINPAFRNLGPAEAARLAQQLNPQVVIPCHYDLFPDNQQPPQLLHTNLKILGLGEKYHCLEHGRAFTFPD